MLLSLVLLDLSTAFDTIDHSNLFTVLGKHVGICDEAMILSVSYLSDRKQQIQIDNNMSHLASIICGVPQGSVLDPLSIIILDVISMLMTLNSIFCLSALTLWQLYQI